MQCSHATCVYRTRLRLTRSAPAAQRSLFRRGVPPLLTNHVSPAIDRLSFIVRQTIFYAMFTRNVRLPHTVHLTRSAPSAQRSLFRRGVPPLLTNHASSAIDRLSFVIRQTIFYAMPTRSMRSPHAVASDAIGAFGAYDQNSYGKKQTRSRLTYPFHCIPTLKKSQSIPHDSP